MTITPDQLVNREVQVCLSYLVSTLANGTAAARSGDPLTDMIEQAMDLCAPIDDWEEAAIQAGMKYDRGANESVLVQDVPIDSDMAYTKYDDLRYASIAFCDHYGIDPYEREVFEHWAVSQWFGEKLATKGEKVDFDFAGLVVWARTTTGQGIASDSVVEAICADLDRPEPVAWLSGADLDQATNPNA